MDGSQRLCSVSASSGKHVVNLTIHFPANYPHVAAPNFEIISQTGVGSGVIKKLYRVCKIALIVAYLSSKYDFYVVRFARYILPSFYLSVNSILSYRSSL